MSALAPGLLVAAPPLGDPNFDQSVVLLMAHNEDGAFGWVVNGKPVMTVGELLVHAGISSTPADIDSPVRVGGPVAREQVWLLLRVDEVPAGLAARVSDVGAGIVATASREALEAVAEAGAPPSLVALVGYAGWAPGQLEDEIRAGAWLPTDVYAELVFDTERERVWQAAYERVGASPMAFTTRTVGSA